MTTATKTKWRIAGEEFGSCNCAWGCPCQFNALPTHGRCEALIALEIREGYYGQTRLDGVRLARIYHWPGPIHEGNGTRQMIIDEQTAREQREALLALDGGAQGGAYFEVFAAVCPNVLEPLYAPITMEVDRTGARASVRVGNLAEARAEPIKNPVTGGEHRARIVLPHGFEFKEAEVANTVHVRVNTGTRLAFEHQNTYAQLNAFDWSSG